MHASSNRSAFTLVELLVVIAIIGVLVSLLLPAVQKVREAASRLQCQNNLKQIGIALHNYHDANHSFPRVGQSGHYDARSWMELVLPFIEEQNMREMIDAHDWWADLPQYLRLIATPVRLFLCPSCPLPSVFPGSPNVSKGIRYTNSAHGITNYLAVAGTDTLGPNPATAYYENDGVINGYASNATNATRIQDIKDGTSETLLVGERPPAADLTWGWWAGLHVDVSLGAWNTYLVFDCSDGPSDPIDQLGLTGTTNQCTRGASACHSRLPAYLSPGHTGDYCDTHHFWSFHSGGANWLYADGSVRFMPYAGGPLTKKLATRAGGENVENPW